MVAERGDPRLVPDQDHVCVDELPTLGPHAAVCLAQELERRDPPQPRVVGGKQRADVAEAGGAEQRVDQRVCDHVPVRVPGEPLRGGDLDAAEHEWYAVLERVRVEADPHALVSHGRRLRAAGRVSRSVGRPARSRFG